MRVKNLSFSSFTHITLSLCKFFLTLGHSDENRKKIVKSFLCVSCIISVSNTEKVDINLHTQIAGFHFTPRLSP